MQLHPARVKPAPAKSRTKQRIGHLGGCRRHPTACRPRRVCGRSALGMSLALGHPRMGDHPSECEAVMQAIRDYLNVHPHAADSIEGVASWWLAGVPHGGGLPLVEQALAGLIEAGVVSAGRSLTGRVIYSANPHETGVSDSRHRRETNEP